VDGRFATAVVGTFWAPTATLTVSNAGHPRPMMYRAKDRAWSLLQPEELEREDGPKNLPLGVDRPTSYDQMQVRLRRGDLVFFYSDSLIESSDLRGELLGEEGLLEVLSNVDISAPERVIRLLLESLEAKGIGHAWGDDVTALLIRRNEMELRMGVTDAMRSGWRMAGRAVSRLMGDAEPVGWPEFRWATIGGLFWRRSKKAPE
jgi:serine phosphatase RsbU (regulator of sigma subunit)